MFVSRDQRSRKGSLHSLPLGELWVRPSIIIHPRSGYTAREVTWAAAQSITMLDKPRLGFRAYVLNLLSLSPVVFLTALVTLANRNQCEACCQGYQQFQFLHLAPLIAAYTLKVITSPSKDYLTVTEYS